MEIKPLISILNLKEDCVPFTLFNKGDVSLSAAAKKAGHTAYKITVMPVSKGDKYSELPAVKAKIEAGYEISHELPFGEWSTEPDEINLIINHKGNKYLRVYPKGSTLTKYFVDDTEMTYDQLKDSGLCIPSFFNKKSEEPPICFTLRVDHIMEII